MLLNLNFKYYLSLNDIVENIWQEMRYNDPSVFLVETKEFIPWIAYFEDTFDLLSLFVYKNWN